MQERLGHANMSAAMDLYSHVMPGMQDQAAMAFGRPHTGNIDGPKNGQTPSNPPERARKSIVDA
jgi:hypothetical protein